MTRIVAGVNDQTLVDGIRGVRARGEDPRPALVRVADDFLHMEQRVFSEQGAGRWRPPTAGTAAMKARAGWSPMILHGKTGRLARSLTVERSRGSLRRLTPTSVTMGSTHPLAHLHQQGTGARYAKSWRGKPLSRPRYSGSLPARPVVVVTLQDEQRWRAIMADWLFSRSRALGL